jgi:hypothetical protein
MTLPLHLYLLRSLLRTIRNIDGRLSTLFGKLFPTEYKIRGTCLQRGVCCQNIAIQLSPGFWRRPWIRRWSQRYYEFVYNFTFKHEEPELKVILFRCNYLTENGKCGIYSSRPQICRNYPTPRHFGRPAFLPGCGYHAVKTGDPS